MGERGISSLLFRMDQTPRVRLSVETFSGIATEETRMILRFLFLLAVTGMLARAKEAKPNVLFIVIDDMNNSISLLDPKSRIKTPNLERLAKRGMLFTRAYCISAACNPSRAATPISASA